MRPTTLKNAAATTQQHGTHQQIPRTVLPQEWSQDSQSEWFSIKLVLLRRKQQEKRNAMNAGCLLM